MSAPRIDPLEPPYPPEVQKLFDLVMPPGVPPLVLFRVLATNARVFPRFMRAGVLDRGPIDVRERELVIHRTTARCGAEYEWGVHVTAFARPLGLSEDWIRATATASADDPIWTARESVLVRLCDALHEHATIDDELWQALRAHYEPEQCIELIYTAGLYHAVSFLTNGLGLPLESTAERFPPPRDADSRKQP
jgi:alkylhydroperoxidase family enzyme